MKQIEVCCALISLNSENGPLLMAAKKGNHASIAHLYEFPGGKLEPNESAKEAIVREIYEETHAHIIPLKQLTPVSHKFPEKEIILIPIICTLATDSPLPSPLEHEHLGFYTSNTLPSLPWAPADRQILDEWLNT